MIDENGPGIYCLLSITYFFISTWKDSLLAQPEDGLLTLQRCRSPTLIPLVGYDLAQIKKGGHYLMYIPQKSF